MDTPVTKLLENQNRSDLEKIKALRDIFRLRLFQAFSIPKTVSDAAKALGVDRNYLYYHIRVLLKAGLLEEVDNIRVRNFNESVYKAVPFHIEANDLDESSHVTELNQLKIETVKSTIDEFMKSVSGSEKKLSGAIRTVIRVKKSNLHKVGNAVHDLMFDYSHRIDEMEDEDGDMEYSVLLVHFEG